MSTKHGRTLHVLVNPEEELVRFYPSKQDAEEDQRFYRRNTNTYMRRREVVVGPGKPGIAQLLNAVLKGELKWTE